MDNLIQLLGSTAGALTTVAFLPQVVKTWRSRSAGDISTITFAVFAIGVTLVLAATILYFKFNLREPPES